jgi:hypothetical protein
MHARIQLVSVERLVFDVFGQMWGTMLLNGLSTISLLAGLLAVCAAEKLAIALVCWQIMTHFQEQNLFARKKQCFKL